MIMKKPSIPADAARQLLQHQSISAEGPGTILSDVESLIDFIGKAGLVTKSKQGNLSSETLTDLNLRLAAPIETNLKRALLRDYPNIGGVYLLLRVMGLVRPEGKRILIDGSALAVWRGMNPSEQYFALMEAWLYHADEEVLGTANRRHQWQLGENLNFLAGFKGRDWKSFQEYCHRDFFAGAVSTWNSQLQARFGLIELQVRPLEGRTGESRGWIMQKARRTLWGDAVTWVILESLLTDKCTEHWRLDPPEDEVAGFGLLGPVFGPFRPELVKAYELELPVMEAGTHFFRVKFADGPSDISCLLAVPGEAKLDEVASTVLKAFKFGDTDHLYEFRYRDRFGKTRNCNHYGCDEGPWAEEIEVGGMGLPVKGVINFLFDFGASWRFELQLERIESASGKKGAIKILESTGRPPEQYPDCGEGWF